MHAKNSCFYILKTQYFIFNSHSLQTLAIKYLLEPAIWQYFNFYNFYSILINPEHSDPCNFVNPINTLYCFTIWEWSDNHWSQCTRLVNSMVIEHYTLPFIISSCSLACKCWPWIIWTAGRQSMRSCDLWCVCPSHKQRISLNILLSFIVKLLSESFLTY